MASAPGSPLGLPSRRWWAAVKGAVRRFKENKGPLVSAGMAFYWFLSVFPALLAAVGITALLDLSQEAIDSIGAAVRSALPGDASRVVTDALGQAGGRTAGASVAAVVVGVAVALWAASAGMGATQDGLDVVFETGESRSFVTKRLRGIAMLALAALLGGVATAAIVFGVAVGEGLRDHLPLGGGAVFTLVWTTARWTVGVAALVSLFAAFYYLGPNRDEPRWTWISLGGAVATAIWLAASVGLSLYVNNVGASGWSYGSFTGVVVLLLWLYLSAAALLLGGEVNAELERQAERERRDGRR